MSSQSVRSRDCLPRFTYLNIVKFLYYYQTPLRCDSVAVFFLWHTFCSVWTASVVFVAGLFNDYLSILKVRIGQYLTANVYRKYELIQGFYAHLNKTYDVLQEVSAVMK